MINTIYVEQALEDDARAQRILARFPDVTQVTCERYGEVFNPKAQNFRLQKARPALILAEKFGETILLTPPGYGIGGVHNYYFSHMMNCIYDCRYCFLQGMYRSAHYVVFVNYERFFTGMTDKLEAHPGEDVWFFSGYDCDSLALEPVTGFVSELLVWLNSHPRAHIELRTKSTQIRPLLAAEPRQNVVVAFSLTPTDTAAALEHKAPPVSKRLDAMAKLARRGWQVGLRFDPILFESTYQERYRALFTEVFSSLSVQSIHSVTLGPFRMPKTFFRNVVRLYPEEPLFASPFSDRGTMISYAESREYEMIEFCVNELSRYLPASKLFSCSPESRLSVTGNRGDRDVLACPAPGDD
ncbi:MAG: hypothetical protein NZ659_06675 [Acidimicrobiales bacterium]|nr:hypothetical protein [Acidimicrobiales bacterium]